MGDTNKTKVRYQKETGSDYPMALIAALSTAVLTFSGVPTNGDTVVINGKTYTWKTAITTADGDVLIGPDQEACIKNLVQAINLEQGGAGLYFGSLTTEHTTVFADVGFVSGIASNVTVFAKTFGVNAYAVSEVSTAHSWNVSNMTGGVASDLVNAIPYRFVSHTLEHVKETVKSDEIIQDRSRSDNIVIGIGARGGVSSEVRIGMIVDFLQSSLGGAAVFGNPTHTIDVNPVTQSAAFSGPSPATDLKGAKLIRLTGLPTAANNGIKRVLRWNGSTAYFAPGSFTVDDASTPAVQAAFTYFRNGTGLDKYLVEVENIDAGSFHLFRGMCIAEAAFELAARAKAMFNLSFMGYESRENPGSIFTSEIADSYASYPIIESTNNVGALFIDNRIPVASVRKLDWKVSNNLRERPALQRAGTLLPGSGYCEFSGTIEAYFSKRTLYRDFVNHNSRQLWCVLAAGSGSHLSIFLPSIFFTGGAPGNPGGNQDLITTLPWEAVKSSYQCQVDYVL